MEWEEHLTAALGYHALGMHQDAWDELERMPPGDRPRIEVIVMRLSILQALEKWSMGAEIARGAIQPYPDCGDLYVLGAYCIRRAENVEAAFEFLQKGEPCLENEPCFWFNLGCYHCQLGRLDEAKECVGRAIELDRNYRAMALEDEDLEPLWDSWAV